MAEVGNLSVKLSLDNAQFERSVTSMNRTLQAMGQEIRGLQNKGKDWGSSIEGLRQKQDAFNRLLEGQQTKVKKLSEAYEEAKVKFGENSTEAEKLAVQLNKANAEMLKTERELGEVTAELEKQEDELARSQNSWVKFSEATQAASEKLKAVGDKMASVGKNLSMKLTAPLTALGAGILKVGTDFDSQMSKVSAVSGATGEDFDSLREKAEKLGATTKFTSSQVAEGMEYLALAGYDTNQILESTDGLLNLAAAAGMNLGRAADITTDTMSAFGMEAEKAGHAADVFAYAQSNANTNVEQLGEAMKYASPLANQMGWTLEQTAAAMMKLADNGLKGGIAGQAFASSVARLSKPTKEMRKSMDELGISFFDAEENMKSLPDIIAELEKGTNGLSMKQKSAAITTIFGAEAYKHWAILLESGSETLATYTKELENSDGTAQNMADTMVDNLGGSLLMLKSAVEGLMIQFSDLMKGSIRAFADWLTELAGKFASLDDGTKKTIIAIGAFAAAIGPVLVITGILINSVGTIVSAFGAVALAIANAGGAMTILGGIFTALTGPIGLTVLALGAVVGAGIAVGKALSKDALPAIERFGEGVSEATVEALTSFNEMSDSVSQSLMDLRINSSKVTEEMASDIIGKYEEMNNRIVEGMNKRHEDQVELLKNQFLKTSVLNEIEKDAILDNLQEQHEKAEERQSLHHERVLEIYRTAAEENRKLTEHEEKVVSNINRIMNENAINYLSENEVESKILLERMKQNAGQMTAEQAAEVVKNSNKQRVEAVEQAELQYDETIAEIIKMRDEMGVISEEQADKMIREATKQKDQTVYHVEKMHETVINSAKKHATDYVDLIDWETGESLSKWEVFKNNFKKTTNEIWQNFKKDWDNMSKNNKETMEQIEKEASENWEKMSKNVREKTSEIWNNFKTNWSNMLTNNKNTWNQIREETAENNRRIAENLSQQWEEMKQSVRDKMTEIKNSISDIWGQVDSFFRSINLFDIGRNIMQGLLDGITDMASAIWRKAQEIADSVKNTIAGALGIKSPSRVMIGYGENIGDGLVIGMDDKIKKVVNAGKRMAVSVTQPMDDISVGRMIGSSSSSIDNSKSYSGHTTIKVYTNNLSPSEIARKTTQAQRQLAMEWGV